MRKYGEWINQNKNVLFFVGGFIFDAFTIIRIDSLLDILIQTLYIGCITFILIRQVKYEAGLWEPSGWVKKFWHFETEAIHFFYGGLLSAYVILYFKSTTGPRSMVFFGLTLLLMFANEMPQVKEAGSRMRLGLHAFCVVSFLNYLIPILVGRMGTWTFLLAVFFTALISYGLVKYLAKLDPDPMRAHFTFGWPPLVALVLVTFLYFEKWIPPVPLSMQYAGIYHQVERVGNKYELTYPKPAWYRFWQKDSRPFIARPGDVVHCFVRVFAPSRFTQEIFMQWSVRGSDGKFHASDRIPLAIHGGRDDGFRGVGEKSNYSPGNWRVAVITDDGRVIGQTSFTIETDSQTAERVWRHRQM